MVSTKANSKATAKKLNADLDLKLPATGNKKLSLSDFKGQKVVLYFYPKDLTSGCSLEAHDFAKLKAQFDRLGVVILGVSRDSVPLHEKFRSKLELKFDLISDPEDKLTRAFDVIQKKSMYGREYEGIERSTFVFDENLKLVKEWRKVKVAGHVQEVYDFIKSLS